MPVDQQDSEAISAVILKLRQAVLDAGTGVDAAADTAAQRLAALALFDIGLVLQQRLVGEPDAAHALLAQTVLDETVRVFHQQRGREPADPEELLSWLREGKPE